MIRVCLAAIVSIWSLAPAFAADSTKEMSPASRAMSVADRPILSRNISADLSEARSTPTQAGAPSEGAVAEDAPN